jgi:hypothetical protein
MLGQQLRSLNQSTTLEKYANCPQKFISDELKVILTPDQIKVTQSDRLIKGGRISIKAGHGVGKTCLAASLGMWFKHSVRPSIVLTTAPTQRQVKELLWREIRHRHGIAQLPGKPLTMSYNMNEREYMLGFSTDDVMQMQGFHCENIMVLIDEANGYPAELFNAVEGWLSGGIRVVLIQIGNPVNPIGPFFDSFSDGVTDTYTISCLNHPNVLERRNIIPGAVKHEWVELQRKRWGEESAFWLSRVAGEFPKVASDVVINLLWVEHAEQVVSKCKCRGEDLFMGYDPAEYGDDEHAWVIGCRHKIHAVKSLNNIEPAQGVRETKLLKTQFSIKDDHISIDGIGAGAPIASQLKLDGVHANRVVVSNSAHDSKEFEDLGTELYWNARNILNPGSDLYIPFSFNGKRDQLKADLCTRKFQASNSGRRMLEPKRQYRARLKRSPNHGDAFVLCYSPFVCKSSYGLMLLPDVIN